MAPQTAIRRNGRKKSELPVATGAKVYSYIRFSTPEQAEGDSERRQVDKARAWAKEHGLTFDESLRADRGYSAYHGHHRKKGYLGKFLQRVQNSEVPSGSILVVEELRRLTREGIYVGLKETVFKLFDAGITIQTLTPEITYNRETVEQPGTIITLTLLLQIAHEESKVKSDWRSESWKQQRTIADEEGKAITRMCPDWLTIEGREKAGDRITEYGKYKAIPEAVEAIVMIFQWRNQGLRAWAITRKLNATAPWTPPEKKKKLGKPGEKTSGWNVSYVRKILTNRAVIGEHQHYRKVNGKRVPEGEPRPDHYPNILAKHPGLFEAVQTKMKANAGKSRGGRNDKATNLLQKLVTCAYCGGAMHLYDKGDNCRYLKCYNGMSGKRCHPHSIRYDEVEKLVLMNCPRLNPERVLPKKDEQSKLCKAILARLEQTSALVSDKQERIETLYEEIEITKDAVRRKRHNDRIDVLNAELADCQKQLAHDKAELAKAERGRKSFIDWQADFESMCKALKTGKLDVRQRLNSHLRDFIDHIEVFPIGHRTDNFKDADDGDRFQDELSDILDGQRGKFPVRSFANYVIQRRTTKAGRFVRIHWQNGNWTDFVPDDSLATGLRLINQGQPTDEYEFAFELVRPNIEQLYADFSRQKPKPK